MRGAVGSICPARTSSRHLGAAADAGGDEEGVEAFADLERADLLCQVQRLCFGRQQATPVG